MSFPDRSLDLLECDTSFSPHQTCPNRASHVSGPLAGASVPSLQQEPFVVETINKRRDIFGEYSIVKKPKQNSEPSTKKRSQGEGAVSTQDMIKKAKILFRPSQEDPSIVSSGTVVSSSRSTELTADEEVNNCVSNVNIPVPPSLSSQPLAQSTVDLEWPGVTPGPRTENSTLPYSTTSLLELQWREQMEQSIEVQDVTDRLGLAKFSVRGLELRVGEAVGREKDLEEHCKRVEEILRPTLLVIRHKIERGERVEVDMVRECLVRHPWGEVLEVLKHQVEEMKQERGKLVRLLDSLRRMATVVDNERRKDVMDLIRSLVRRLGAREISWEGMEGWEKEAVRMLVAGIQGIPKFVSVILDQLLVGRREVGV